MAAAKNQAERDGAGAQNTVVNGRGDLPNDNEDYADGEEAIYVPEGYDTVQEYLQRAIKLFDEDYNADEQNLLEAMEDLRFTYVDQWDPQTRMEREAAGRPCLTINTLPQFVGQVIGDRRMNKTSIKVIPVRDATMKLAETRSALIKTIENQSRATRVYDMACEDQVVCGIGNFQVEMDYAYNDVFEQDIFIRPIPNPLGVIWDFMSVDPTGRDAKHCFVIDEVPIRVYEEEFPDYPLPEGFGTLGIDTALNPASWINRDTVKVVAFWEMIERPAKFAMMLDGQVEDVTDMDEEQYMYRVAMDPNGQPFVRDGIRPYARRHLITSFAILDGPYELPLTRLPVIRVSGRVGRVGVQQVRFGLIRWARDASLMRNYWRSTAAETLAMAPKNQWIATASAVQGREDDFRKAHLSGDPLLIYNDGPNVPQRQDPPNLPTAVLNESQMNAQDIKDVTGIQDASLGVRSNEVSGKAIMARQREGDIATITFHDNLNEAIQEGGDVVNQLIPLGYDTMRTVRLTGVDDKVELVRANDPNDENSPDLTTGKYDVTVITGPSYTTQRMESAELMLELVKVNPQLFEVAGDLLVAAQDGPGMHEIAERLKKANPLAQEEKKPEDMTPEELQAMEQQQQQAQQQEALKQQMIELEVQEKEADVALKIANAKKAAAEAALEEARAQRVMNGEEEDAEDPVIADAKRREAEAKARAAEANARKAEADAEAAEHQASIANDNVVFNRFSSAAELDAKDELRKQSSQQSKPASGASRRAVRPASQKGKAK